MIRKATTKKTCLCSSVKCRYLIVSLTFSLFLQIIVIVLIVLKFGPVIDSVGYWVTESLVKPLSHWSNRMTELD